MYFQFCVISIDYLRYSNLQSVGIYARFTKPEVRSCVVNTKFALSVPVSLILCATVTWRDWCKKTNIWTIQEYNVDRIQKDVDECLFIQLWKTGDNVSDIVDVMLLITILPILKLSFFVTRNIRTC